MEATRSKETDDDGPFSCIRAGGLRPKGGRGCELPVFYNLLLAESTG